MIWLLIQANKGSKAFVCLNSVLLPERLTRTSRALHLRHPESGFSRATSIHSLCPMLRAPESVTPSADRSHFPTNFTCRYVILLLFTVTYYDLNVKKKRHPNEKPGMKESLPCSKQRQNDACTLSAVMRQLSLLCSAGFSINRSCKQQCLPVVYSSDLSLLSVIYLVNIKFCIFAAVRRAPNKCPRDSKNKHRHS